MACSHKRRSSNEIAPCDTRKAPSRKSAAKQKYITALLTEKKIPKMCARFIADLEYRWRNRTIEKGPVSCDCLLPIRDFKQDAVLFVEIIFFGQLYHCSNVLNRFNSDLEWMRRTESGWRKVSHLSSVFHRLFIISGETCHQAILQGTADNHQWHEGENE